MITQIKRQIIQIFFLSLLVGLLMFVSGSAGAREQEEEEFIVEIKTIKGELTTLGSQYLGILSERDERKGYEKEVLFLLDEEVKFVHKERNKIKLGDRIRVKYEEYYKPPEDEDEEPKFAKRVAKEIQFLSPSFKGKLIGKERQRR